MVLLAAVVDYRLIRREKWTALERSTNKYNHIYFVSTSPYLSWQLATLKYRFVYVASFLLPRLSCHSDASRDSKNILRVSTP